MVTLVDFDEHAATRVSFLYPPKMPTNRVHENDLRFVRTKQVCSKIQEFTHPFHIRLQIVCVVEWEGGTVAS